MHYLATVVGVLSLVLLILLSGIGYFAIWKAPEYEREAK